jgi:hypothetical protein
MQEYDVNVLAAENGFALSVNPVGSSGSTPYLSFSSWLELRSFLQSLEVSNELVRQLDEMGRSLRPGSVFKERMFLPEVLIGRLSS